LSSLPDQPIGRDDVPDWSPADARAVDLIRVLVSKPCVELFAEQDDSYQQEVPPAHVRARVSVEAGVALGCRGFVGDAGECVCLEHSGESADYQTVYKEFGFAAEHVVTAAKASLARVRAR
jgi:transketolase